MKHNLQYWADVLNTNLKIEVLPDDLDKLKEQLQEIFEQYKTPGIDVHLTLYGKKFNRIRIQVYFHKKPKQIKKSFRIRRTSGKRRFMYVFYNCNEGIWKVGNMNSPKYCKSTEIQYKISRGSLVG